MVIQFKGILGNSTNITVFRRSGEKTMFSSFILFNRRSSRLSLITFSLDLLCVAALAFCIPSTIFAFQISPGISKDRRTAPTDSLFSTQSTNTKDDLGTPPPVGTRIVKIPTVPALPGSTITVPVVLESIGGEAGVGFTLVYNSTKLTVNSVTSGTAFPGAFIIVNDTVPGKRGVAITQFVGLPPPTPPQTVVDLIVVNISFTVGANALPGEFLPLTFDGSQTPEAVSICCPVSTSASNFIAGAIQILSPTAAAVSVGGRITTAAGNGVPYTRMTMTDSAGAQRIVMTNPFGYYRFDGVQAGEVYIIQAASKHYTFSPPAHVISVTDQVTGLDFMALE